MPDFNQSMQGAASTMRRSEKDWMTTLLLCLFCGGIGVHRYYVGKIGTGILYTLTLSFLGIGCLIDLIKIISGKFTDKDGRYIQKKP